MVKYFKIAIATITVVVVVFLTTISISADGINNDFDVSLRFTYDGSNGQVEYVSGNFEMLYNVINNINFTLTDVGAVSPKPYLIINNTPYRYFVTDLIFTTGSFQEGDNILKMSWGDLDNFIEVDNNTIVFTFMAENYNAYELTVLADNTYTYESETGNFFNDYYESTFSISIMLDESTYDWFNYGYFSGYDDGFIDDVGYKDGYDDGVNTTYINGFNDIINPNTNEFYKDEDSYSYGIGYKKAFDDNENFNFTSLLAQVFMGLGSLLAIELLPNITIGAIISVPIVFGIIAFIIGKRGGKND